MAQSFRQGLPAGPILIGLGHLLVGFRPGKLLISSPLGPQRDFVQPLLHNERVADVVTAKHAGWQTHAPGVAHSGH